MKSFEMRLRLKVFVLAAGLVGLGFWTRGNAQDAPPGNETLSDALSPESGAAGETEPLTQGQALVRLLVRGGWTMAFLLAASIVALAHAIERAVNLRRSRLVPPGLAAEADALYRQGEIEALRRRLAGDRSTLARVVEALIEYRDSGPERAGDIAGDIAARSLRRHNQRAYPLAVVATLSPLLGLMGTVIGMIGAFGKVEAMGELANAAAFGGDISKALITTAAGLVVAIPSLALYHYFRSRISLYGVLMEEQASELVNRWFIKPPAGPAQP